MSADATLRRGSIQKLFEVRFWPIADVECGFRPTRVSTYGDGHAIIHVEFAGGEQL